MKKALCDVKKGILHLINESRMAYKNRECVQNMTTLFYITSNSGSHSSDETLRDWNCLSLTWRRLSRTRALAPKISHVLQRPAINTNDNKKN